MDRFEELKELFKRKKCFKLVCGAGNEDVDEIRKLAIIYTLAGANILDLSANRDIVKSARQGVNKAAYEIAPTLGKEVKMMPFLNVSIGIKGDPHVRKARIDEDPCTRCMQCFKVCRQEAFNNDLKVMEYRCIGCGDCEKICQEGAIYFIHKKADFDNILPDCVQEGVETMELHAVTKDEEAVFNDWELLNKIISKNFVSMCLDRSLLSNDSLIERVKKAYEITGERLIIQADGIPMGGEGDDYNTTLQAIACADIIQKSGMPVMILLSGGTNSKTGVLAKQCGVEANGVAIGSWARKIVREFVKRDDFYSNLHVVRKAVAVAEDLINSNIEAISG